ncbi:MAG: TIR domain-containing protein [Chlorobium sp.]|nr:MAG: TIR domain-containing protein [Chlorobium sp.]
MHLAIGPGFSGEVCFIEVKQNFKANLTTIMEVLMQIEVFVSYAKEDHGLAELIVKKLEKEGLIVWWWFQERADATIDFREDIENAIHSAQSVLVLWTKTSIRSAWVKGEAEKARIKDKLVQLCSENVDDANLPLPFNQYKYFNDYDSIVKEIKRTIGIRGPLEHIAHPDLLGPSRSFRDSGFRYLVPGMDLFLSFFPCDESGVFLSMRLDTTNGWITTNGWKEENKELVFARHNMLKDEKNDNEYITSQDITYIKVPNDIYLIKDPIRPFTIQIGEMRAMRPNARPGMIDGKITDGDLDHLPLHKSWLSKTLAEIISDPETLQALSDTIENEPRLSKKEKQEIQNTIARNPNAPRAIQKSECLLCNVEFRNKRRLSDSVEEEAFLAFIVANDFPFGPFFHYMAITSEPVHSWEELSYKQMKGLNLIIHLFLKEKGNIRGAAGIGFGFNSTIRHLVLGTHSHSSAGASIPHIHKQVWGMAPGTSNLANQLIEVSQAYENHGIDYQGAYLTTLALAGYVIWKDDYVKLYVPYGQSSLYELQAMVSHPRGCFTDLSEEEVISLSKAEYVALRLFKALGINSFNHVMLSKLFNDKRAKCFRLVEIFITREVDLAVSELSSLYVVNQHPWDSRNRIMEEWEKIKDEVLLEIVKEGD